MFKKFGRSIFVILAITLVHGSSAMAQTIDFETYILGSANGQDGWSKTGPFDHVVAPSLGTAGFGAQSYRISNAITSGSFGDQTFTRSLTNEAGETSAVNNGLSGGIRQRTFEVEFDIASAVPGGQQPGLVLSTSPDRGDGARQAYLRFEDLVDGIHVFFNDYQDLAPFGGAIGDPNGCNGSDNFFDVDIATLSRTPHSIKIVMFFIDGPRNDVVQVYIDGALVKTGTSWEDYHRYCASSPTVTVDSLLFRTAGTAAPATSGNGFLFDNFDFASTSPAGPTLVVDADGLGSTTDCNDTTPAFTSINSAVLAANPGDTVRICSGTYVQPATTTLNKAGLTLLGVGPTRPVIQAAAAIGNVFSVSASNVTLNNLEIQKTDVAAQELIAVQGNNFTATNNLIYGPDPGTPWSVNGIVSRAFVVSNNPGFNISNNVISHLRQPAYVSGSLNVAQGTISNNQVFGTRGWVIEGGNVAFSGNSWPMPENQGCDIAILNQPGINPAFYQPLTTLSSTNSNAYICAQFVPGAENGRAIAYVDSTPSLGSGSSSNNYTTIQEGINGVLTGGTVQVAAGGYNENLTIPKALRLTGAGHATTSIIGPIGGGGATIFIGASNVEIDGFTITRAGNNTTDWYNPGLNTSGISIPAGPTGSNIHDNSFIGNRTAIDINNSGGHSIHNNDISNNRTGMIFRNTTNNNTVTQNNINNNWTVGIVFLDGSPGASNVPAQTCLGCSFTNNSFSGNWYGAIVDRQSGGAIPAPGTILKNFSGNWFGTSNPVVTTANSTEPGYAGPPFGNANIPTAFGGTATAPGGQPDIAGPASANFDFSPFLNSGTDTSATYGFQGSFAALNISAASPQAAAGNPNNIQEGIDAVTAGGILNIGSGIYAGNVNVNKVLDIKGNFTVTGTFNVSAAGASVSPGLSPGIINTGNLTLGAGTTTNMEINGTTVGTQYDQLNVTGTVNINPTAALNVTLGFTPIAGNSFTIINNDGGDSVTGTFSDLDEGDVFYIGMTAFQITYAGGSNGNDVVLTVVNLCNAVSIPTNITTLTGNPSVVVPVNVDDTTGNGLYSTDFTLTYNPAVLSTPSVALGPVTSGGAPVLTVNTATPGVIVVSVFNTSPFAGAGALVNVTFSAIGLPGTSTPVSFSTFKFNEGTPCISTSNGLVTILSGTISGVVTYGNSIGTPTPPRYVPNVLMSAVGSVNTSATTNGAGFYSLSGMGTGAYTVTPSKIGGATSLSVSGLDSACIAQYVVGIAGCMSPTNTPAQLTVANVSGTGGITSFDAALIARFAAGLPSHGSSGTWRFTPISTNYADVNTDYFNQDYSALLMGDVTGNYNPALPRPAVVQDGQRPMRISAPEMLAPAGGVVSVPVSVQETTGKRILSYQFDLRYDPTVLEPATNTIDLAGTISEGYSATVNPIEPGLLKVVVFGVNDLAGAGELFKVNFNVIGDVDSASDITWEDFVLNEGGLNFETRNGRVVVRAAANDAAIDGRVLSAAGQPVAGATVTITDTLGQTRATRVSSLGHFRFAELTVGQTYTITVSAKRYTFASQTVSVTDGIVNLDLIAEQ